MAKKVITITVDTDYDTDKVMVALLDAVSEAQVARGGDYVYRTYAHRTDMTKEELDEKVASNMEKCAFYRDAHSALFNMDITEEQS
jgi:hypothetical protein